MRKRVIDALEDPVLALLRIVTGFLFTFHGAQKVLGAFGGMGGSGHTPPIWSLPWIAGTMECVGGPLIMLGFFSRPVAFILSGEMAFAYFIQHAPRSLWPILNHGEEPVLFCFIFLYLAAKGPGSWSVDQAVRRMRNIQVAPRQEVTT